MAIKRASRKPDELGSLDLFIELDEPVDPSIALHDAARIDAVVARFIHGLTMSLANPSRLHGRWTEGMFPAVVLALGRVRLLKNEDAGPAHYFDDAYGTVNAPDFRIVTAAGDHLLVEVKGVAPTNTLKKQTIRKTDLDGARRYAEWTGARLMIAHYWAGPNLWTLVDSHALDSADGRAGLTLEAAVMANELGMLGDAWIGTTPPLVLSLVADTTQPRTIDESGEEPSANFVIGEVKISCQGRPLETSLERRIAWGLMAFGGWHMERSLEVDGTGTVTQLNCTFRPAEPVTAPQGFEIVSPLSSMYAALYTLSTLDDAAAEISTLRRQPEPGVLVDLIPSDYWDTPQRALPIWRLNVLPRNPTLTG